jgi:hypothetical protein
MEYVIITLDIIPFCIVEVEVEVEVTLRPTVSRPVRLGVLPPFGASDQMLHLLSDITFFIFHVGRPL